MKISILTENNAGPHTMAEHGMSYLIEFDEKHILFDTGQSDMFLRNAERMKVSMMNVDTIVLSHGHFDHGNGLNYLSGGSLICHPGCFVKRYKQADHSYIGLKWEKDEIAAKFDLLITEKHYKISDNIFFLGEVPRLSGFESKTTAFVHDNGSSDFVMDDSGLAMKLPDGLFVITGCGHSGIVNILEHAKKISGQERVLGIMGGFHLKEIDKQTKETISYLRKNRVKHIYPSHCTELPALSAFYEAFGIKQVKSGCIFEF